MVPVAAPGVVAREAWDGRPGQARLSGHLRNEQRVPDFGRRQVERNARRAVAGVAEVIGVGVALLVRSPGAAVAILGWIESIRAVVGDQTVAVDVARIAQLGDRAEILVDQSVAIIAHAITQLRSAGIDRRARRRRSRRTDRRGRACTRHRSHIRPHRHRGTG